MADTEKELLISPVVGENIIHNTKARTTHRCFVGREKK